MNVPNRVWNLSEFLVSTQFSYSQNSGEREGNFFNSLTPNVVTLISCSRFGSGDLERSNRLRCLSRG